MIRKYMAAAILAVALVAGACGGTGEDSGSGVASIDGKSTSSKGGSGGSKKSTEADREKAALAFSRCMRANGVDMPDPGADGMMKINPDQEQPSQEAMQEAEKKCKKEREALQGSFGEPSKEFQEKALQMARCVRSKGFDMPDPTPSKGGGTAVEFDPEKLEDPEFQKAMETCRKQVNMPAIGTDPGGSK